MLSKLLTQISYNYEPAEFWRRKFPPIISPTKEAFETGNYSYLFINSLLLFKPVKTRGSHFRNFCSTTKLEEKYNQTRYLPDHFGPRSWSSGRAQGSKSSSSWFPFHPGLFPAFSPESAVYPLFSFCEKSFLEVKNVSNKSKSLKNDQREYGTYCKVMSVAICHFHVSMFGWNSREVRHDANDEIWKILRI